MKKPKNRYNDPHYTWLRVAIWQAYNCKDYYNGEAISFREMEIDHIVSQDIYKTPNKLKKRLRDLGLPEDFQKDDLLNFVPTRGGTNVEKYKLEGDQVLLKALSVAKQKKESIKQKIDQFFSHANAIEVAAQIAANITCEEQRKDVIDIILHDMEDFREETCLIQNSSFRGLPNQFVKSTKYIRLIGYLPNFKNPTPSCVIEFRTLFLRGITLCVPGIEVLNSLCRGNYSPIDGKLRGYLQKDYHNDYFYWTLGNCSFELDRYESEELCDIIDQYADTYINALQDCEKAYDFEDCNLVNGSVRLFQIRQSVYNCVYQYIIENPTYYHGLRLECNLNMFRLNSSNGGLHFMIMLESAKTLVWHREPRFWMTLSAFYGERDGIMEREELWAPSRVRQWLLDKLIPDAIRWSNNKSMPRLQLWNKRTVISTEERVKESLDEIVYSINILNKKIPEKIHHEKDLVDAVNSMQSHFALNSTPGHYSKHELRIFDALLILLEKAKLKTCSYEYIAGNLGCLGLRTKEEIIVAVKNRIKEQKDRKFYSEGEIELVLRCLKECIDKNAGELGFQTINDVINLLSDLVAVYNRDILIKKYL